MKQRFKFILSSLIVLSLIGLGEDIFISCPNVKYYIEAEWLNTASSKVDESKCFYYNQFTEVETTDVDIKRWSNDCILYYNKSVKVEFISQTNVYCELRVKNFLIHKTYIPRKSIENYSIS